MKPGLDKNLPLENQRFVQALRQAMIAGRLSQRDLCKLIGCTIGTMTKYLTGAVSPYKVGFLIQCQLAEVLGVQPSALLGFYKTGEYKTDLSAKDIKSWIRSDAGAKDMPGIMSAMQVALTKSTQDDTVTQPEPEPIQKFEAGLLAHYSHLLVKHFKEEVWNREVSKKAALDDFISHLQRYIQSRGFDSNKRPESKYRKILESMLSGKDVLSPAEVEITHAKYGLCPLTAAMQSWTKQSFDDLIEAYNVSKVDEQNGESPGPALKKVTAQLKETRAKFSALMHPDRLPEKGATYSEEGAKQYGELLTDAFSQVALEFHRKPEELFKELMSRGLMKRAGQDSAAYEPLSKQLLVDQTLVLKPEHVSALVDEYGTCPCFSVLRDYLLEHLDQGEPVPDGLLDTFVQAERTFMNSVVYEELNLSFLHAYFNHAHATYMEISQELGLSKEEAWSELHGTLAMQAVQERREELMADAKAICLAEGKDEINSSKKSELAEKYVAGAKWVMGTYKTCPMFEGMKSMVDHQLPETMIDIHNRLKQLASE